MIWINISYDYNTSASYEYIYNWHLHWVELCLNVLRLNNNCVQLRNPKYFHVYTFSMKFSKFQVRTYTRVLNL